MQQFSFLKVFSGSLGIAVIQADMVEAANKR